MGPAAGRNGRSSEIARLRCLAIALPAELGREDLERARVGIAQRHEALADQNESDGAEIRLALVQPIDDRSGHEVAAIFRIEPARHLDLAHLFARRHLDPAKRLDGSFFVMCGVAQIDPNGFRRNLVGTHAGMAANVRAENRVGIDHRLFLGIARWMARPRRTRIVAPAKRMLTLGDAARDGDIRQAGPISHRPERSNFPPSRRRTARVRSL